MCAVSGGADSLALLVLACRAGLRVTAVHVDHGLRRGSAAEAAVVASAAERFGAGFRSETVVVEPGSDLENRARRARLRVLGPDAMTGHTADDQAETVLINLIRGAGLDGIAAMEPGHRHPILALRRAETEALCAELGLVPVEDPTNRDRRFVRNRIRHEVLPLLGDISDRDAVPLLTRSAEHARRVAADLDILAAELDPTDCRTLSEALPSIARQALRRWLQTATGYPPSSAELERVMAVVRGEVVACEIEPGLRISRSGQRLSAN
ncbi:MAG: tRNA lysidine(34) synthetase TilS [Acidimicrobiia bacterium]|nr:tRNA lysidine(34) synthetase TilS [Acidimicrobiia bacterium]